MADGSCSGVGWARGEALGLGVYGEFAYSAVAGLLAAETALSRVGVALSRLSRLAMAPDGEVALARPAIGDDAPKDTREAVGKALLDAAHMAAYAQFGWGRSGDAPRRSAARMRSCPDAHRGLRLAVDGADATLAECACLAEAVAGLKGREALVKAYGEGTVRRVVGSPADPVTTAAIEALERKAQAVQEEADRRIRREKDEADRDMRGIVGAFCSGKPGLFASALGLDPEDGLPRDCGPDRQGRLEEAMNAALRERSERSRRERRRIAEERDARISEIACRIAGLRAIAGGGQGGV